MPPETCKPEGNRVLRLDSLLSQMGTRPNPAVQMRGFVPPRRFARKSFDSYQPRHPSQAAASDRLQVIASELASLPASNPVTRLFSRRKSRRRGLYLDGGFGVGKTHLLAALWKESAGPKSYLSFDELMYFVGLFGAEAAPHFEGRRLIAIDEWELDDPGNLTMAIAFLRVVLADGAFVAVTSNTLPLELGSGRFSQKDFCAEIEELASAFEVLTIEGDDYRHRHFDSAPSQELFWPEDRLAGWMQERGEGTLVSPFAELIRALETVHPIRYGELASRVSGVAVQGIDRIPTLPESLRWVHFIDSVYNAGVPFGATGERPLSELFPPAAADGPFGKKLSRCLSRMEELLTEGAASTQRPAPS